MFSCVPGSWNKRFNAASLVYLQPVKHSSTLLCWSYHTFSFSSHLPFPFTMPWVIPDTFRINFKLLPYYACTSHWKVWYRVIIWILCIYVTVCDSIFTYNFLGNKCCSCCCSVFMESVMSEFWLIQNCAHSQAHMETVQTRLWALRLGLTTFCWHPKIPFQSGNRRHNVLKFLSSSGRLHMRSFDIVVPSLQVSWFLWNRFEISDVAGAVSSLLIAGVALKSYMARGYFCQR